MLLSLPIKVAFFVGFFSNFCRIAVKVELVVHQGSESEEIKLPIENQYALADRYMWYVHDSM
jgi:hypothetical protein